jgi:hypothetical protein
MPQPDTLALVDFAENGPFRRSRRDFLTGTTGRRALGDDYRIRVHRRALACRFEITLTSGDAAWVPAARTALNEIGRIESEVSAVRAVDKGYLLDGVAARMRESRVAHALLSAGRSSLLAIGGRNTGWHVDLVSPRRDNKASDRLLARVWLRDAAISTSGAGEQCVMADRTRSGCVIDPPMGRPASGVWSASAIASSAERAEALSTTFLGRGVEFAECYCAEHPGVVAVVTPEEGKSTLVFGCLSGATVQAVS